MKYDYKKEELEACEKLYNMTEEERMEEINNHYNDYYPSLPPGEYKKLLLNRVLANYITRINEKKDPIKITFYKSEIDILNSIDDPITRRLFYCLYCWKKVNNHPSGWIRFEFETIISYGFDEKAIRKNKIKVSSFCGCEDYGFSMTVRGAGTPIVCYSLPKEEGEEVISIFDNETIDRYNEVIAGGGEL